MCRRTFARAKQAHSCLVVPLSAHLDRATPDTRRIFDAVMRALERCGPVAVVPTKTMITLLSNSSLGGLRFHKDGVRVGFVLTRKVSHPRIVSTLQLSPRSVHHQVHLRSVGEVDAQLRKWLKEAYDVGLMAGRRE